MTEIEIEQTDGAPAPQARGGWFATGAGMLGALAMTSCCILPLVLVSLGVTGVFIGQLTALYAYKWLTFGLAAGALGYGFWAAYRPVPAKDCGSGTCARPIDRGVMRGLLWGATAVVLLALAFPAVAPLILTF
ncbi:mercuric ion transport protein [Limimaricola variabilis]|uniref:Mercuric transport protein MerT n=1 Tax=Limimaricola variabilis TaxID=1492771 RepID=A0ABR6HK28_9RHOB|nr:mercuric transporter MerT family protein [Limimaricola variabilis]MBB3710765.1 mercuric ion transport protein [Limimaricola variabilis]